MKRLWVAAALAPLSFAASAHAQTVTNNSNLTAPVTTTTTNPNYINNGSIVPTTGGNAAITMTTPGNVTNNGTISFSLGANSTIGILAPGDLGAGNASVIDNAGAISLLETTTGDSTAQSITNGPFANGGNRTGIEINGPGAFNGTVFNSGSITIIGENSAGIAVDTALNGDLDEVGTIAIVGGTPTYNGNQVVNAGNVSYGVHAIGPISGNVTVIGTISATGQNATGVALGDVGGASGVNIEGGITATGYRSTAPSTDPNVLALMTPDQFLQGGPALELGGNVANGVVITAAAAASGNIAAVPAGALLVDGSAPALLIGGANAITIGTNSGNSSLAIGGSVTGVGIYADVGTNAIQIGGSNPGNVTVYGTAPQDQFANVTMASGVNVTGAVQAGGVSKTSGTGDGDANAIIIGSGATLGDANHTGLTNSGVISATVTSDSLVSTSNGVATGAFETSLTGKAVPVTVTGITIQAGGNVSSLNNSGAITATITGIATGVNFLAQGGTEGQVIAINDQSGSLGNVTNTGLIGTSITPIIEGQSINAANSDLIAMYLANTDGNVTVTQNANANVSITPSITGSIIFGNIAVPAGNITGSENLALNAGTMAGNVFFGGSGNNTLAITGGALLTGAIGQAAAGSLSLDIENGTLDMLAPVSNTVGGYVVGGNATTIHAQSLNIGSAGQIIFAIDPTAGNATTTPQITVAGNATIAAGAKIGAGFTTKLTGNATTYELITAGSLTASNVNGSLVGLLPYLYKGVITTTATDLDLTVSVKTAQQLDFNPAQSAALSAIYNQMSTDPAIEAAMLSQTDRSGLLHIYNQLLPDYAGGVFEGLATAQRAIADAEAEAPIKLQSDQTRGWVQEIGYLANHDDTSKSNGYQSQGFGLIGGIEHASGDSAVGVTASFISNGVANNTESSDGQISTDAFEVGAYWRAGGEGLQAHANVNGGYVSLGSHRTVIEETTAGAVTLLRDAESQWSGAVASANFGVGYQITHGRLSFRPEISADYIALIESGHSEKGGGPAVDLAIASRTSTEASAQADVVIGYTFGQGFRWTPQLTLGYRQILTGGPGSTTAQFLSGSPAFTLTPDLTDRGGLLARLGVRAAGQFADVTADAGGEFRDGYQTYDARARARFLF
jgi:hypothetical protein